MKFMNMRYLHNYCEEAGEGEGGGSGGDEPTVEQLQAKLAESEKSNASLLSKNTELLGETKKAKQARKDADAAAAKAAEEKAKANGDHEQLYKSAMQENESLKTQISDRDKREDKSKVNTQAMKIAIELADGYNAEILSEAIAKRLKVSDGEVKVTDTNGELTVSTFEDLKSIFKGNERFASLLKGNQSSGGSAAGGDKGGSAAKVMTRAEHNALDAVAKAKFFKDKGKLVD